MKVLKWQLEVKDYQTLLLPKGAKVLDIQPKGESVYLWALCDLEADKEPRKFAIYGTGYPVPEEPGQYQATVQLYEGSFVGHIFEVEQ